MYLCGEASSYPVHGRGELHLSFHQERNYTVDIVSGWQIDACFHNMFTSRIWKILVQPFFGVGVKPGAVYVGLWYQYPVITKMNTIIPSHWFSSVLPLFCRTWRRNHCCFPDHNMQSLFIAFRTSKQKGMYSQGTVDQTITLPWSISNGITWVVMLLTGITRFDFPKIPKIKRFT